MDSNWSVQALQSLQSAYAIEEAIRRIQRLDGIKRRNPYIIQMENRTARSLRTVFRKIMKKVLAQLSDSPVTPSNDIDRKRVIQAFAEHKNEFLAAVGSAAETAAIYGSQRMGTLLPKKRRRGKKFVEKKIKPIKPIKPITIPADSYSFGEPSARVIEIVRTGAIDSGTITYARYSDEILAVLEQSYADGKGIFDTVQDLKGTLESMEYYEMERIARTTINGAQNRGAYESLRDNGIQYGQWWTAEDDRVRGAGFGDAADHITMHGQIVEVGRPFSNGLYYPGDQSGDVAEFINCRCVLVPYLMPEGIMAPIGMDTFYETDLVDLVDLVPIGGT